MSTRFRTDGREPYTRRQFLALVGIAAAAVAAGGAGSCATAKPPAVAATPGLRPVWRLTPAGWERVRMFELRDGDRIRVERHPADDGTGVETVEGTVIGEPAFVDDQWGVQVTSAADPQTVSVP